MKRTSLLLFTLAVLLPIAPAKEATPLLKDREVKKLADLFADYFRSRAEEDYKGMSKSFEKLEKQLESTARSKKVDSLLVSPVDLRAAFSAPMFPDKRPKKGFLTERSAEFPLAAGQVMKVDYLLQLPKGYRPDTPSPCILALPPAKDRLDQLKNWAEKAYPDALTETAMVVIPYRESGNIDWMSEEGRQLAFFAFTDVYKQYHVDRLKLFLEGHGPTGPAAVDFASALPTLFSGVILRSFDQAPDTTLLGNADHLPFLLLSAGEDDAKRLVAEFADEAKAKGVSATIVDATIEEDGGADEASIAKVAEFLTGTRKDVAPKRVTITVPTVVQSSSYWISLAHPDQIFDPEKPISLEAEVFSESNEFRVKTPSSVLGFTIYLNDELVDMGKPIKVVHTVVTDEGEGEAKTLFEGTKARNFEFALQSWFLNLSGNIGEVYTNSIDVEVPQ
ncbi:MAG: hypothetical protein ACF8XB_18180 [Planctomycetota bacterium JB042]